MTPDDAFDAFANGAKERFDAAAPRFLQEIDAYLLLLGVKRVEEREDLGDEAIFHVVKKTGKLAGMGAEGVRAYVFTICKNLVVDRARVRQRKAARPKMPDSATSIDPVLREALEHCISSLSDEVQAMFRAHHLDGLPKKRIAQLKGIPERTCQDHLKKAKGRVTDCLRRQGYVIDDDEA